ncbi:M23 family metallopeptidase [Patescibacteria group bacterium AH-259-L05]|nr:M23 family metallopeptidase [Patescibacteria group bacterium AH-259-L05]
MKSIFIIILVLMVAGIGYYVFSQPVPQAQEIQVAPPISEGAVDNTVRQEPVEPPPEPKPNRVDFSQFHSLFRFSGEIPNGWKVEFVPEIIAFNIYNPESSAASIREQSQIFIRYFEASRFLTLSTVDITLREETKSNGHPAVRYEIIKKPGVPNFPHQPGWRNEKHRLIDIRFTNNSPSLFYVFTYTPSLEEYMFDDFINSLTFHNDLDSIYPPIDRILERSVKKSFGLKVSPEDSPIQPERFSGYHTGVDYEVFGEELEKDVFVRAICGGKLRQKQNADGYGGVAVQDCLLQDQAITVVYGHLKLTSIILEVNSYIAPGSEIGILGAHQSIETDGERKHLHLGIRKGTIVDIRGYVENESELTNWLDPRALLSF